MNKNIKETLKYCLRAPWVIRPYINEVEKLYAMTPEELKVRNEKRFIQLFRKAYNQSPFYHRLYSEAGISLEDINCLDDIKKLPILTKDMIKQHGEEIRIAPKWKLISNHTSGTTGSPLMVYEDWPSIWREQAYFYCYRKRCGYTYGEPLVSLRGNLDKKDLYLKVGVSNTLYLSSYNINPQNAEIYYQQIVKHRPVAIEGYPSSLYSLALMLREQGLQLQIPVAFTSSETLLDYQRVLIEKQLGTQIYDHYGTTERTIRLSEAINHQGYFEDPGYSINEYTEDGEITTSLINFSFPLIRYKGNDIIELMEAPKENPQVIARKVQGRKSTYLEGKDGTKYSGALLTRVFKEIHSIDYAQFVQSKRGEVQLNYVPNDEFTEKDKQTLIKSVEDQLGKGNFEYSFHKISPNEIIYSKSGKFQYIISFQSVTGGVVRGIQGRNEDYIICKDGSRIMRLGFIMKDANHIKASQIIQEKVGAVILKIVPDDQFIEDDGRKVLDEFQRRVGTDNLDIQLELVDMNGLIKTASGKFKYIISKISK